MRRLLPLIFAASVAHAETPATIVEVLEAKGSYAVTDGSSVYTFYADHRFDLRPAGMSGRTVKGVWVDDDGKMRITGQWGWVNGASPPGDYREMVVYISPRSSEPVTKGRHVVYDAYTLVEALHPVDEATFTAAQAR